LACRICLIKSVFTTLPLFYLSFFKAPKLVCKSIISIQRRFLWDLGKENKPIPWVSRENLCKSKQEDDLGIKDIWKFNAALLAKWKWRLVSEEERKWKDLLVSKYGSETDNLSVKCTKKIPIMVVERLVKGMQWGKRCRMVPGGLRIENMSWR